MSTPFSHLSVRKFRITRRWRFAFKHYPPVDYVLTLEDDAGNRVTGTLRRSFWLHIGPYEIRVTL